MSLTADIIDPVLLEEEPEDIRYINSPFRHLKKLPPKQKGMRYEQITEDVLKKLGYRVDKATTTDYDRLVDGLRVEMKGSCLGKNTDNFSFLQIRPDQKYDSVMFTMLYPDRICIMELD